MSDEKELHDQQTEIADRMAEAKAEFEEQRRDDEEVDTDADDSSQDRDGGGDDPWAELAKEFGYRDEFPEGEEPEVRRTAKEFIRVGLKKIRPTQRKLREAERKIEWLERSGGNNQGIKELAGKIENLERELSESRQMEKQARVQTEIDRLNKERIKAVNDGDTELFLEIDDQIQELRDGGKVEPQKTVEREKPSGPATNVAQDPIVTKWLRDHPQYETNRVFRGVANDVAEECVRNGVAVEQMLERIEAELRAENLLDDDDSGEDDFGFIEEEPQKPTVKKPRSPTVESGGLKRAPTTKKKLKWSDLTYQQQQIFERLHDNKPEISKERYLARLENQGFQGS